MWTVVYIAPNKATADYIKQRFEKEGILVNIRPISISAQSGEENFEISVLEGETEEALDILNSALGTH